MMPTVSRLLMTDRVLLADLRPLSIRSSLDAPALARSRGRSITVPADISALVDHVERGLFELPGSPVASTAPARRREAAASVAFQAVVAQMANPMLLAHRVLGVGLRAAAADVRWRAEDWAVRYGLVALRRVEPGSIDTVVATLRSELVGPWLVALAEVVPVPERTLRGNADAAIWTAVRALHALRPMTPDELDAASAVVLGGLEVDARAWFTRDTCCWIHVAGLTPCTECPLDGPDAPDP